LQKGRRAERQLALRGLDQVQGLSRQLPIRQQVKQIAASTRSLNQPSRCAAEADAVQQTLAQDQRIAGAEPAARVARDGVRATVERQDVSRTQPDVLMRREIVGRVEFTATLQTAGPRGQHMYPPSQSRQETFDMAWKRSIELLVK